ncbi:hypothetical protein MLD38_023562 [Melastoma candidum]|uniref:Uncharacterized protein n=1 Tax=Melastoma candidum TaxID=119954 RepID=A0ACB9NQ31_9MYRT|nr:hypothetical protein MLD38_023562 [Melastoma candidum]
MIGLSGEARRGDCIYYLRTGFCGYGPRCRFNHPRDALLIDLTFSIRLMPRITYCVAFFALFTILKTASVYMRTGTCKFGSSCKYHHPRARHDSQQSGSAKLLRISLSSVTRPPVIPSYVHSPYGPVLLSPGMVPLTGYSPYQASGSPVASSNCKYGSSCRYHHPPEANAATNVILNPLGLPLRPGVAPCMHFARGECKFGPACKFDHSVGALNYSSSVSSLGDAPIIPYPAGLPYMNTPDPSLSV